MRALGGLAVVATAVVLSPAVASAQDRLTHAAVGAVAGAVVAGPVGLLGGGLIGYVAGPQIACDLGVERCHRHRRSVHHSSPGPSPGPGPNPSHRPDVGERPDHGNY